MSSNYRELEIEYSFAVEKRFTKFAKTWNINEAEACARCIAIAFQVMNDTHRKNQFLQGNLPLAMPETRQLLEPAMSTLKVQLRPQIADALEDISFCYAIDNQSVISWGMDCIEAIETAERTRKVSIKESAGRRPFVYPWL